MRKVIAATFVSLDGVMQGPGGPEEDDSGSFRYGGWTVPYFDEAVGAAMGELFSRPFALLIGRRTYDIFAAHWPRAEDGPDADLARMFNAADKYVATRSPQPLAWSNSVALRDAAQGVAQLKRQEGPDLIIQGSSNLIQTLLVHGLIDEFRVLVFPVVLGGGKRLFERETKGSALKLVDSKTSSTGVVVCTYQPAGEVRVGSFAL